MILPQPGIFAVGTSSHAYLELDLLVDADPVAAVRVVIPRLSPVRPRRTRSPGCSGA